MPLEGGLGRLPPRLSHSSWTLTAQPTQPPRPLSPSVPAEAGPRFELLTGHPCMGFRGESVSRYWFSMACYSIVSYCKWRTLVVTMFTMCLEFGSNTLEILVSVIAAWLLPWRQRTLCVQISNLYAGWASHFHPPHSLHETTQHRYCRCRPLAVAFVYYEFGN